MSREIKPAPQTRSRGIVTSIDTMREAALERIRRFGWKPGDKMPAHSVAELMAAFGMEVQRGEVGCDYPSCGCCADAACEDANDQHPDLGGTPVDTKPAATLDERMKAAGMLTIAEMMGVTPLTRWKVQVGMTDLDIFSDWLDRKVSEYLSMKAAYDLGDKDENDELYEWVLAHVGAYSSIRENFRAARAAPSPSPNTPLPTLPSDERQSVEDGK